MKPTMRWMQTTATRREAKLLRKRETAYYEIETTEASDGEVAKKRAVAARATKRARARATSMIGKATRCADVRP
jgi:hypothetical protein